MLTLCADVTIAFENTVFVVDEGDSEVVVTIGVIIPDNVTVEPGLQVPIFIETENGTAVGQLITHRHSYSVCVHVWCILFMPLTPLPPQQCWTSLLDPSK